MESWARGAGEYEYLVVVVRHDLLPGEHGYRFFPSFYRNLFDTMERIPLVDRRERDPLGFHVERAVRAVRGGGRVKRDADTGSRFTVRDNLRSVELHAISTQDGHPPAVLTRTNRVNVRQLLEVIDAMQRTNLDVPLRDLVRAQLRMFRFLTSCPDRREDLADRCFFDFITEGDTSKAFQDAVELWPQALVGLRARSADARTYASVMVQLAMDQLRPGGFRDGTLAGPTTDAWFDPWREYLSETYGVEFVVAELAELRVPEGSPVEPVFRQVHWPGVDLPAPDARVGGLHGADYYVFAMDLAAWFGVKGWEGDVEAGHPLAFVRDLAERYEAAPGIGRERNHLKARTERARTHAAQALKGKPPWAPEADRDAWIATLETSYEALAKRTTGSTVGPTPLEVAADHVRWRLGLGSDPHDIELPFRQYAGIQYFLELDYAFFRGHMYHAGSPWALSSISQEQFRNLRRARHATYGGVLSVIIGAWDVPGPLLGKPAWSCDADEIAREVWWQIVEGLRGVEVLPDYPLYYHLDEAITAKAENRRNRTPFLVNDYRLAGRWPERPDAYQVRNQAVFCGTWMSTYTRLVTMEAANESARHAVNALLRHLRPDKTLRVGRDCPTFDLEGDEIPDLAPLVALDQELFTRGLPHFMEILDVEDAVLPLLDGGRAEGDRSLLAVLQRYARSQGELGAVVGAYLVDLLGR